MRANYTALSPTCHAVSFAVQVKQTITLEEDWRMLYPLFFMVLLTFVILLFTLRVRVASVLRGTFR